MSLRDKLHLMVVDDMSTSRGLIQQALDEIGLYHVGYENDARMAYRKLAARPLHLVISDYNMPEMNGLQLLQALRMNKPTARIGFILVSGRIDQNLLAVGQKLGLNNFIQKPFTTAQMKACIETVVGKL